MASPSQDSTPTPKTLHSKLTEQDIIQQTQEELLALIRVAPDESLENLQKLPVRLSGWSIENEISQLLW